MYRYFVYGRIVTSSIYLPLPRLEKPIRDPDSPARQEHPVTILRGRVAIPEMPMRKVGSLEYGKGETATLISIPGIAACSIDTDSVLVIDSPEHVADEQLAPIVLHVLFPFLLKQVPVVLLHGSAAVGGEAGSRRSLVLLGGKGSGKSTTAALLTHWGWNVLCDDIVPVSEESMVMPGIPVTKLLPDARAYLASKGEIVDIGYDGYGKFRVLGNPGKEPVPLGHIGVLFVENRRKVLIEPVSGMERVRLVLSHVVSIDGFDQSGQQFGRITALLQRTPVLRIIRPVSCDSPAQIAEALMKHSAFSFLRCGTDKPGPF